jgi:hypothetical protein
LKGRDFYFGFLTIQAGALSVEYYPDEVQPHPHAFCSDWNALFQKFNQWVFLIKRELKTTNPWVEAKNFGELVFTITKSNSSDMPITKTEREAIWRALTAIQETLLEHVKGDEEKGRYVLDEIRILKLAIEHFGKKDYLMLLYTTIIGISTTLGVTPENLHDIGKLLYDGASTILRLL